MPGTSDREVIINGDRLQLRWSAITSLSQAAQSHRKAALSLS